MSPVGIALAVPLAQGRVLVARRAEGGHLAGHWEFPGGKIRPGERPAEAAARELAEETGLVAAAMEPLLVWSYDYPGRPLRFHAFLAPDPAGRVSIDTPREWAWKRPEDLPALAMPPANVPLLRALERRIGAGG